AVTAARRGTGRRVDRAGRLGAPGAARARRARARPAGAPRRCARARDRPRPARPPRVGGGGGGGARAWRRAPAFLRDVGKAFVTRLAATPDLEELRGKVVVDPPGQE